MKSQLSRLNFKTLSTAPNVLKYAIRRPSGSNRVKCFSNIPIRISLLIHKQVIVWLNTGNII